MLKKLVESSVFYICHYDSDNGYPLVHEHQIYEHHTNEMMSSTPHEWDDGQWWSLQTHKKKIIGALNVAVKFLSLFRFLLSFSPAVISK